MLFFKWTRWAFVLTITEPIIVCTLSLSVVVIEIVQLTVYHSVIDDLIFDLINIEHKVIYETDYLIYKLENTNKRLNEIYWYKVNIKRGHKYLRAK